MKKSRLSPIGHIAAGGVVGVIEKGMGELRDIGKELPKAAKEVTESPFLHELIHLEKKPKPLGTEEAVHARELLDAGASMEDVGRELGYRPETMRQLLEDVEVSNGDVRGFF